MLAPHRELLYFTFRQGSRVSNWSWTLGSKFCTAHLEYPGLNSRYLWFRWDRTRSSGVINEGFPLKPFRLYHWMAQCMVVFLNPHPRMVFRGSETSTGCLLYASWPGIEPTIFLCTGWRSNQLSHPARPKYGFKVICLTGIWNTACPKHIKCCSH